MAHPSSDSERTKPGAFSRHSYSHFITSWIDFNIAVGSISGTRVSYSGRIRKRPFTWKGFKDQDIASDFEMVLTFRCVSRRCNIFATPRDEGGGCNLPRYPFPRPISIHSHAAPRWVVSPDTNAGTAMQPAFFRCLLHSHQRCPAWTVSII